MHIGDKLYKLVEFLWTNSIDSAAQASNNCKSMSIAASRLKQIPELEFLFAYTCKEQIFQYDDHEFYDREFQQVIGRPGISIVGQLTEIVSPRF